MNCRGNAHCRWYLTEPTQLCPALSPMLGAPRRSRYSERLWRRVSIPQCSGLDWGNSEQSGGKTVSIEGDTLLVASALHLARKQGCLNSPAATMSSSSYPGHDAPSDHEVVWACAFASARTRFGGTVYAHSASWKTMVNTAGSGLNIV